MTKTQSLLSWLLAIGLVAITAAQSWQSFEVSPSAGGGVIQITGLLAFPVIGTLIALQIVIILVSLLVKPIVTRILAAIALPLIIWSFFEVLLTSEIQVQETLMTVLASQTGVVEELSSSEFLVSSSAGAFTVLYLISAALNALFLAFLALAPVKNQNPKAAKSKREQPEDLWSSQN
jgi:hypothetical protein